MLYAYLFFLSIFEVLQTLQYIFNKDNSNNKFSYQSFCDPYKFINNNK